MENNNLNNTPFVEEKSEYEIDQKVIAKITKKVLERIDGVLDLKGNVFNSITSSISNNSQDSTSGINIDVDGKSALVHANVILEYGKRAPEVFNNLDKAIKEEVLNLTGITVRAVKANIVDIMTKDEFNKKKSSNQNIEELNN